MRRAKHLDRAGSRLIYAHHATVFTLGMFGMIEGPSPAVASIIGGAAASTVWSLMFAVFGMLALVCRVGNRVGVKWEGRRHRLDTTRSEALCIALIGVGFAMFGGLVAWAAFVSDPRSPGAIQTALALLASSAFLPGVAAISLAKERRERLQGHEHAQQLLTDVAHEVRRSTATTED